MKPIIIFFVVLAVILGGCEPEPVCVDCHFELDIQEVIAKYNLPEAAITSDGTVLAATNLK